MDLDLGGLIWYLEARNWAFEKIKTSPHGSHPFDLQMHHSLFFVYLLSATDHIDDYLKKNRKDHDSFSKKLKEGFGDNDDYYYVRELRNSVVHRGLNPTASGHSDGNILYVLCPAKVKDRNGKAYYSCSFKYLLDLAQKCHQVFNLVITDVLKELNLFDPTPNKLNIAEIMNVIDNSTEIPYWAKELSKQAFTTMDLNKVATEMANDRADKMRSLLSYP